MPGTAPSSYLSGELTRSHPAKGPLTMTRSIRRSVALGSAVLLASAGMAASMITPAFAALEPGTPERDVHIGLDNDNAANPFVQPPGVVAPQHTDDTDLLFGRGEADLLIGGKGSDTLLGGPGPDILVGGPDRGGSVRGDDVLVSDDGDDVAIWSPDDGNDLVDGNDGTDTLIVGPAARRPDGGLRLDTTSLDRTIPRVDVDGIPTYSCTLVPVPASEQLGTFLLRFSVSGTVESTLRLKEMERVLCPGATAGTVQVADLTSVAPGQTPVFHSVPIRSVGGLVGAIIRPVGGRAS